MAGPRGSHPCHASKLRPAGRPKFRVPSYWLALAARTQIWWPDRDGVRGWGALVVRGCARPGRRARLARPAEPAGPRTRLRRRSGVAPAGPAAMRELEPAVVRSARRFASMIAVWSGESRSATLEAAHSLAPRDRGSGGRHGLDAARSSGGCGAEWNLASSHSGLKPSNDRSDDAAANPLSVERQGKASPTRSRERQTVRGVCLAEPARAGGKSGCRSLLAGSR